MTIRETAKSTLAWAFGISLTILFISLWGRAVVVDTDALGESLAPLSSSALVVDYVADWMGQELVDSGVAPEMVDPSIDYILESTTVGQSLDQVVVEIVDAAATPDANGSVVDVRQLMLPAVPDVSDALSAAGYPATESEVRQVVEGFDPLVIREPGQSALVGPSSPTATRLGLASLLASVGLATFGAFFVKLSEDRIAAIRSLFTRVAIGGLSFAIFLRVGAWVVDPEGGRAPIPETIGNLAQSKWVLPLQVGLAAAAVALTIYAGRRLFKRVGGSPPSGGSPTPPQERPASLSGSR